MTDVPPERPGKVITFYSYKGGTGRSMALANIACLLAKRQNTDEGKPVLAIDWDLEAPGLHRYFEPFLPKDDYGPGLIELFLKVRERIESVAPEARDEAAIRLAKEIDLRPYARPTRYPKLTFMRAGHFDGDYPSLVNTFPWPAFFTSAPSFMRHFALRLAQQFSYVLIDSRTGVTDISGICTMLMPEQLVVVFTPNRQSLTGITELVTRATDYRRGSDDLRPMVVFPLPSRIDTSFPDLMKSWREGDTRLEVTGWQNQFKGLLQQVYGLDDEDVASIERYFDAVQLPHIAQYAYGEPLVLDERSTDKLTLLNSYSNLRDYLLRGGPWIERADTQSTEMLERKIAHLEDRLSEAATPASSAPQMVAAEEDKAAGDAAALQRKATLLEDRIRASTVIGDVNAAFPAARSRHSWRWWAAASTLIFFLAGLLTVLWSFFDRRDAWGPPLLAQLLRPESQTIDPATVALLLMEVVPTLKSTERDVAVNLLRQTVATIPPSVLTRTAAGPIDAEAHFSADGRSLLIRNGGEISIWDAETGRKAQGWTTNATAAAFLGDGTDVVTLSGDRLDVWRHGAQVKTVKLPIAFATAAFVHDGRLVTNITSSVTEFRSIDALIHGQDRPIFSLPSAGAPSCAANTCALIADVGSVVLFDLVRETWKISAERGAAVRVSNDGQRIVIGDFSTPVRIVDVASDRVTAAINVQSVHVEFCPDSSCVVAALTDGSLRMFDARAGTALASGNPGGKVPISVQSVGDGRFALVVAGDEIDIVGPSLATTQFRVRSRFGPLSFNSRHDRMAIVNGGTVSVYDVNAHRTIPTNIDQVGDELCKRTGDRFLTQEEWTAYMPSRAYTPRHCRQR
jgi:MinD-like ATPase involved in chromosome partitioning or flagellar assembly